MRISRLAIDLVMVAALAAPAAAAQSLSPPAPDTVTVTSGPFRLTGLLWKPEGSGPFPAILFSHGSGLRVDAALARDRALTIGPVFAKHGYAFLYLFRRGYGLSGGQGEFIGETLDREANAHGEAARKHLQLLLLTTDQLDDVMAGLSFLKNVGGVDAKRIALAGHSVGGQLTLLAAERDKTIRAAVTFAAAAQSWEGSSELQARMLAAVRNLSAPVFLSHAANDYSLAPGRVMAAELARLRRPHQLQIYRAVGKTPAAGHEAVYTDVAAWEGDVFRFLGEHLRY